MNPSSSDPTAIRFSVTAAARLVREIKTWIGLPACVVAALLMTGCQPKSPEPDASTPNNAATPDPSSAVTAASTDEPPAFSFQPVGPPFEFRPTITNVQVIDLDQDGRNEVLACDAQQNAVYRYVFIDGGWSETKLADGLVAPAHATVVDLDADNDLDIVVSVMGNLHPDDGVIGSVVLLEQDADGQFSPRTILSDVRRVVDVQPGDFDSDGDLDLAVAVFGYLRGEVVWLENQGAGAFVDHQLLAAPGTIHVPVADFDNDGDLDIAAIVSQEEEEVWLFDNDGAGKFTNRRVFFTPNFDIGSAGLVESDLDRDGDVDLLLPVGDNLEDKYSYPQPYHGCIWLENEGGFKFTPHRIANFPGTYAAAVGDLDQDNDEDVVLVSMVNDWADVTQPSVVWLENDGQQNFDMKFVASRPIQLTTVAIGDIDHDERLDIVAGGLHVFRPYEAMGRISAWLRDGPSGDEPKTSTRLLRDTQSNESSRVGSVPRPHLSLSDPITERDLDQFATRIEQRVADGEVTVADWQDLGQAYFSYGFFASAATCFESAIALSPDFEDAYYWRAMSASRTGELEAAIDWFAQARTKATNEERRQECDYQAGRCHLRAENLTQAEEAFERAGVHAWSLLDLAKLQLRAGRATEAAKSLDRLADLAPFAIEYLLLRSQVSEALGQQEAAANYRALAEYNERRLPESGFLLQVEKIRDRFGLRKVVDEARQLANAKRYDEAIPRLRSTLSEAWSQTARLNLAIAHLKNAQPAEAIEQLETLLTERGDFPQALVLLGDAYAANGDSKAAQAMWERTAAFRSGIGLHQRLQDLYERQGDSAKAKRQAALRFQAMGIADLRHSKLRLARKAFDEAVAIDPTLDQAWFYLGESLRLMGDTDGAQKAYARCLEANPHHGRALKQRK